MALGLEGEIGSCSPPRAEGKEKGRVGVGQRPSLGKTEGPTHREKGAERALVEKRERQGGPRERRMKTEEAEEQELCKEHTEPTDLGAAFRDPLAKERKWQMGPQAGPSRPLSPTARPA